MRDTEQIKIVGELLANGKTLSEASRISKVPLTTVHRWATKMEESGNLTKKDLADLLWDNVTLAGKIIKRGLIAIDQNEVPLKVEDMQKLSTVMGTNYDKHALATGGATDRVALSFEEMPENPKDFTTDDDDR